MAGKKTKAQIAEARVAEERALAVAGAVPAEPSTQKRMFAREVPALDLSALTVLVINDNEFLRIYMERLFSIMRVGRVVTSGDAVAARRDIETTNPDIVLIDLDLSGTDGLDLVRHIRRGNAGIPKDVAILVASAFVDRDYVVKARNAGINWTLVKPLTFRRLYEGLARVILDERPFIESETFTGPDRRLLIGISGYDGFERRKDRKP